MKTEQSKRIIGLDMHPDVFAAAALSGDNALRAKAEWVHDRQLTNDLERWARKHLRPTDEVVLEASGNSFEVVKRLAECGIRAKVLESVQASHVKDNFCNDDRHSAVKLAKVYLSGLAKEVWTPDLETRQHREILFCHRNAVKDTTRARNRIRSFLNEHCVRLKGNHPLTAEGTLAGVLALRPWSALQRELLKERFEQLWEAERRRKRLEKIMVQELVRNPKWARLWRLMGIRHCVAFGLMAVIGQIERFESAKRLVGYFGLAPGVQKSGNDEEGDKQGVGGFGRKDVRALLIQSAHNALNQKGNPLHKWGWKLLIRKHRNLAAAAVARKLTVAIWHLLMGHYTPLEEHNEHLQVKLLKLATVLGSETLKEMGYSSRTHFLEVEYKSIQLAT